MNEDSFQEQWYAVRVKSRHEKTVSFALRAKQYQEFLPLYKSTRRWADRLKEIELPLFPGYVFCRFDPLSRVAVLHTPGVVDVVRYGSNLAALEESEIKSLRIMVAHQLRAQPWEYVRVGQTVTIQEGSMKGLSGIVLDFKRSLRLVLSVSLLQRSVLVEIDQDNVRPSELLRIGQNREQTVRLNFRAG